MTAAAEAVDEQQGLSVAGERIGQRAADAFGNDVISGADIRITAVSGGGLMLANDSDQLLLQEQCSQGRQGAPRVEVVHIGGTRRRAAEPSTHCVADLAPQHDERIAQQATESPANDHAFLVADSPHRTGVRQFHHYIVGGFTLAYESLDLRAESHSAHELARRWSLPWPEEFAQLRGHLDPMAA